MIFRFGPFSLDVERQDLLREGQRVELSPKAFQALALLCKAPGRIVTKEELMRTIWPDAHVEEANVTVTISMLRRALGQTPKGTQYIETVPKRGYRLSPFTTVQTAEILDSQQSVDSTLEIFQKEGHSQTLDNPIQRGQEHTGLQEFLNRRRRALKVSAFLCTTMHMPHQLLCL